MLISLALRITMTAILLVSAGRVAAQTPAVAPPADSTANGQVRVFLDCHSPRCDFDFMRDQIRWVNWVRDRLFADVQLLVTSLSTGSGGTEYTVTAIGVDRFRGRADTAVVFVPPNEALDVARRSLARTFSLLVAPYAARTSVASRLTITYAAPSAAVQAAQAARDRWNFWTYRIGANGFTNGEKRSSFRVVNLNLSANRVTAAWRASFSTNIGYEENRFNLGEGGQFLNLQRNYGAGALVVKSLGEHLSAGVTAGANRSDFFNQDLSARLAPAIEYNVFPYKEFTRRQLTANYSLGVAHFRYQETTIFDRDEETRPVHNLTVGWNARQP